MASPEKRKAVADGASPHDGTERAPKRAAGDRPLGAAAGDGRMGREADGKADGARGENKTEKPVLCWVCRDTDGCFACKQAACWDVAGTQRCGVVCACGHRFCDFHRCGPCGARPAPDSAKSVVAKIPPTIRRLCADLSACVRAHLVESRSDWTTLSELDQRRAIDALVGTVLAQAP